MDAVYGRMLVWSLHHRPAMMGIAAAVVLSAAFLYPYVGKELVPDDDQGEFSVNVRLPRGTSYQRTEEFIKPIEKDVLGLPGLQRVMQNVNSGFANFNIMMVPLEERSISQQELMIQARQMLRKYPGRAHQRVGRHRYFRRVHRRPRPRRRRPGRRRRRWLQPAEHPHPGPRHRAAAAVTVQLMDKVREIPGVVDVDTNFEPTQPELRINVDRARAADLGVNIDSLANSLRTLVGGEEVSEYKDGDDQFKVVLRLDEEHRNPATMGTLLVPAAPGKTVKVSDVATLKNDYGPASIDRYNRQRQISVNANLQGVPLGEALAAARDQGRGPAPEARLPGGVRRQRAHARRGVEQLRDRARPRRHLHLHGARLAVQFASSTR